MQSPIMAIARLIGCAVMAAGVAAPALASGFGGEVPLHRIVLEGGEPFLIAPNLNPDGCQRSEYLALPNDPATRDRYLSLVMTALAADMKVEVWVDGCASAPWGTVPRVYHLNIGR